MVERLAWLWDSENYAEKLTYRAKDRINWASKTAVSTGKQGVWDSFSTVDAASVMEDPTTINSNCDDIKTIYSRHTVWGLIGGKRNLGTVYKISKLLYGKCTKVKKTVKKVKLPKLGRGMAPSVHQSVSRVSHSLCYLFKASPSHQDGDSHWLRQEQAGLRKGRGWLDQIFTHEKS